MDIRDLRTFIAVADAKSFLKAADTLYISRQAISKTIHHLEEELHLELFVRNQNGALMTPAGIFLYSRAAQLVQEFDRLKEDTMNLNRSYRPTIRLSLSQGIYGAYASILREYAEKYTTEMELITSSCFDSDAENLLVDHKADAILTFTKPNTSIAKTSLISRSRVVFLVQKDSPRLKGRKTAGPDLMKEPKLLYTAGYNTPLWWYDHPGPDDITCAGTDYLFTLLMQDRGIAPVPEIAVPNYLKNTEIIPVPSAIAPVPVYYSTLYPEHYTLLSYSILEAMQKDLFPQEQKNQPGI